jgi:hypothetical protein
MLGVLQCKIYDEPKEHQKDLNIYLQIFSLKQEHHNFSKPNRFTQVLLESSIPLN